MTAYGKPYTVRGWGDEVVTTVAVLDETAPEGYRHVVRGTELAGPVILVPTPALTPVDTTPAEPEPGAWLIGKNLCVRPEIANVLARWLNLDDCDWYLWEDLWRNVGGPDVPIVRLVPEPAPVTLPWRFSESSSIPAFRDFVTVEPGNKGVAVGVTCGGVAGSVSVPPDEAEVMAAALLTAARAAREATS